MTSLADRIPPQPTRPAPGSEVPGDGREPVRGQWVVDMASRRVVRARRLEPDEAEH
jgi:hypothetical protein